MSLAVDLPKSKLSKQNDSNDASLLEEAPPDLSVYSTTSLPKVEVYEWISRIQKYKSEALRYAQQCRVIEKEIEKLQLELTNSTNNYQEMAENIELLNDKNASLVVTLQEETARRNNAVSECLKLRRASEQVTKESELVKKDITQAQERFQNLTAQIEENKQRHHNALEEKERLRLERRWFFHERLLLEKTRQMEVKEVAELHNKFQNLKVGINSLWKTTKEANLVTQSRTARKINKLDEWYAARRRRFLLENETSVASEN
ncbi:uncharacterized protein LOC128884440 [Hylaeus volcanicus]|uniref:uncharacterized protein LOC128884440 n=1 Tax=Hylaeus volcanicus TaxID=313075 RepID=UPI0023B77FB6|nr:uncharacterized protein LOC128884440 [Hylaeus volcanicus]